VLEHVIGFHDVLLLRPLGAKLTRPRDDVVARWSLTVDALRSVFARPGLFDGEFEVPAVGELEPTRMDARRLVPALSQDVLVHTWDLARAVGADDRLGADLCEAFAARLPADPGALAATGMYDTAVEVGSNADPQSRLLALVGRDPNWRPRSQE
jgi:uncharacterized protein (TIGR03086 family)